MALSEALQTFRREEREVPNSWLLEHKDSNSMQLTQQVSVLSSKETKRLEGQKGWGWNRKELKRAVMRQDRAALGGMGKAEPRDQCLVSLYVGRGGHR